MKLFTTYQLKKRSRARRLASGFTLIEVTVSLTAGLIVAMGLVALSREASNSFNEEMRSAAAESGSRTAIDRLRADLQRAAFMSTPNIQRDPTVAVPPGQPNVSATMPIPGLKQLASVQLSVGGSAANTPASAWQIPKLNPDAIVLGGNFTSTDQFVVRNVAPPGANASCQRLWLAVDSPAMWRILATENGGIAGAADAALASAFQPIAGQPFLVRISDDTGHYQYLATCPTATGGASGTAPTPWVDIDARTPVQTTNATKTNGGAGGLGIGRLTVNPIQLVRWELLPSPAGPLNPNADAAKYDLVRSYVDVTSDVGGVVAASKEVVAEYIVDLKFAFNVDTSAPDLTGNQQGLNPQLSILQFDNDVANAPWGAAVSTLPALPAAPLPGAKGPQRIRSVRVRLVSRAAIADRSTNITPQPANQPNQLFLYRYCAGGPVPADGGATAVPDCTNASAVWARARTLTTEVTLPNQARVFFL